MYVLLAYIGNEWAFAGIDPHEECAVMFIETIDKTFGEGSAQVYKLPDKSGHAPTADEAEAHANMANMLSALESGKLDLDEALKNLQNGK